MEILKDKYISITGGLVKLSRFEARHKIEKAGGIWKTNGSRKLDILVIADEIKKDTVKLKKIRSDCCRMSEAELYNVLQLRW